jgi:hypothetical protein
MEKFPKHMFMWPSNNTRIASVNVSSFPGFDPGIDSVHAVTKHGFVEFYPSSNNITKNSYYIYLPHKLDQSLLTEARGLLIKV